MKSLKKIISCFMVSSLVLSGYNFVKLEAKNLKVDKILQKEKEINFNPKNFDDCVKKDIIKILKYFKCCVGNKLENFPVRFDFCYKMKRSIHNFENSLCIAFYFMESKAYPYARFFLDQAYQSLEATITYRQEIYKLKFGNTIPDDYSSVLMSRLFYCLREIKLILFTF